MQLSSAIARNSRESCNSGKNINSLAANLSSSYSAAIAYYFFFLWIRPDVHLPGAVQQFQGWWLDRKPRVIELDWYCWCQRGTIYGGNFRLWRLYKYSLTLSTSIGLTNLDNTKMNETGSHDGIWCPCGKKIKHSKRWGFIEETKSTLGDLKQKWIWCSIWWVLAG